MNQNHAPTLYSIQKTLSFAALLIVAGVAWWSLTLTGSAVTSMTGDGFAANLMRLMMVPSDIGPYLLAASLMWAVMMAAMMIPAVLPMTIVYRKIDRGKSPNFDSLVFSCGYLAAWFCFSFCAAGVQWWLHTQGMLQGHSLSTGAMLAGAILIGAGIYQLSPLKEACLNSCRSPLGFVLTNWRDGRLGALRMGSQHGLYCIGCCWVLMLLMFAGGTVSVPTMAALSIFILSERLLPTSVWVSKVPGVLLVAWGGVIFLGA